MKKLAVSLSLSFWLASCAPVSAPPGPDAYSNRGDPESLIDVSSEVINISLDTPTAKKEMIDWINHDQPVRAEISCKKKRAKACRQARAVLDQFGVPYADKPDLAENTVSLIYERIMARDCDNRYLDNSRNSSNINYANFGCSVRVNTLQMVTDKRQFINPALMDYADGEKAEKTYQKYLNPPQSEDQKDSILESK